MESISEISSATLNELINLVHKRYGYDFSDYSKASLKRRVIHFIHGNNVKSLFELKHQLLNNENYFIDFLQSLTVNVTEMFRDPGFYKVLRKKVIPHLASYPYIKIWHAGCSTGEEVYSTAIVLQEEGLLERTKLYATDINPNVLYKAQQGIFPIAHIKDFTHNYQNSGGTNDFSKYYSARYDHAIFDASLRKNMVFCLHNLVSDSSFNEFNLIMCRNVFIYFDPILQAKTMKLFKDSLCMFGYFSLGNKESLLFTEEQKNFEIIDKTEKIFRRIA